MTFGEQFSIRILLLVAKWLAPEAWQGEIDALRNYWAVEQIVSRAHAERVQ